MLEFIGVVIASSVAWIAYQQYALARERFKLDMFEKRFAVYKATQRYLTLILLDGKVDMDRLFEFRRDTQDATFLFGKEIPAYLEGLDRQALALWKAEASLTSLPVGEERTRESATNTKMMQAMTDELPRLKDVFASYLRFDKWN